MLDRSRLEITAELGRARAKFPGSARTFKALTEEVGELAKALLDVKAGDAQSNRNVYYEAVQVATMAIRMMEEGERETPEYVPYLGMSDGGAAPFRASGEPAFYNE